jgi:hypothetical protein
MGILRKLGVAILVYVTFGVIFTFLLLNDTISIHDENILITVLYNVFQPIIFVTNFLYVAMFV